jgi:hypothetical protein
MIASARWRKSPRESGATFFILVQVQAGSPRFALTGYAWRSHAAPKLRALACPLQPSQITPNLTVDGAAKTLLPLKNLV